jgi:hypothetical protein
VAAVQPCSTEVNTESRRQQSSALAWQAVHTKEEPAGGLLVVRGHACSLPCCAASPPAGLQREQRLTGGGHRRDEELGAVGVGAGVGHGQQARLGVLVLDCGRGGRGRRHA